MKKRYVLGEGFLQQTTAERDGIILGRPTRLGWVPYQLKGLRTLTRLFKQPNIRLVAEVIDSKKK